MPEKFMSNTMRKIREDHPKLNWDEDEQETPKPVQAKPKPQAQPASRSPAYGYGAMMRLMSTRGDIGDEVERFTDLSSEETRKKGMERSKGYLPRIRAYFGGRRE